MLRFWILGPDADPAEPLLLLGRLDLSSWDDLIDSQEGGVFRIRFAGTWQGAEANVPVGEPSVTVVDEATWAELFADPVRYEEVLGEPPS